MPMQCPWHYAACTDPGWSHGWALFPSKYASDTYLELVSVVFNQEPCVVQYPITRPQTKDGMVLSTVVLKPERKPQMSR